MDFLKFSVQGAQVYHWMPETTTHPILFCSRKAYFEKGKPIRGGVPVCWPWFGPKEGKRQHGFVRVSEWELISDEMHEDTRVTKFQLSDSEESHQQWAFKFYLYLEVVSSHLGLKIILTTENINDTPIEITQALHTYFQVGDVSQIIVEGLDGATYLDKLDHGKAKQQSGELTIDGPLDRIYQSAADLQMYDPVYGRRLEITGLGNDHWVVWNPWEEGSKNIGDLADDEYKNFICIEAANAVEPVVIEAYKEYKLETMVKVV